MALPATDTFTDTDGVTLPTHNAGWTDQDVGCVIKTNAAAGAAYSFDRWTGDTFNADHQAEATMVTGNCGGPCGRMSGTNNCYMFDCNDSGNTNTYLFKRVAGSYTNLQTFSTTFTSGQKAKITVQDVGGGNTDIKCYKDGVQLGTTTTDSGLTGGSAGVMVGSGTTNPCVDAITVDNLGGGAATKGIVWQPASAFLALLVQSLAWAVSLVVPHLARQRALEA